MFKATSTLSPLGKGGLRRGIATAKVVRTDMNLVETYPSGTLPFGKASPTRTGGTSLLSLS